KNDEAFQQYWTFRGKSAKRTPECAKGSACPAEIVCDLRAGKSSDTCTGISFAVKRSDVEDEEGGAIAAADPTGLHTLYKRANQKPWNKKLCGLTASL
ncbi:hypothetical protein BGW38_005165, partial [Lunasporangiospora selenospora]